MKIHHSLAYCLFLILVMTCFGCINDPVNNTPTTPAPSDTSRQQTSIDEMDKASLKELLADYNPPGRDLWQKPEKVIDKMGDLSNKVVADLGAGSGDFFLPVGSTGQKKSLPSTSKKGLLK